MTRTIHEIEPGKEMDVNYVGVFITDDDKVSLTAVISLVSNSISSPISPWPSPDGIGNLISCRSTTIKSR